VKGAQRTWKPRPGRATRAVYAERAARQAAWDGPVERIMAVVEAELAVAPGALRSACRSKPLPLGRRIAARLALQLGGWTIHRVARAIGRDHSTILHGLAEIERELQQDAAVQALVARIDAQLGGQR
jgi:chromosomal replication initiation ATPase DnaA